MKNITIPEYLKIYGLKEDTNHMKNNLEQVWKEEARKAYQDQQSQDNEGGCREPIGFVQGYLAAKKSDFEEISNERKLSYKYYGESEQLKIEKKQLEQELQKTREHLGKAIKSAEFFMSHADCKRDSWACKCSFCRDTESSKNLREARQYFQDKDKQGE